MNIVADTETDRGAIEMACEEMAFDVVIAGAGPAGLATAIRLKQIDPALSVVIVEKGAGAGAHILSGAIIDPIAIDRLLPGWRNDETLEKVKVSSEKFMFLAREWGVTIPNFPLPPLMRNKGFFVLSLGQMTCWLAKKAEALGVEIYPGFGAAELLFDAAGAVRGVATSDMGRNRDGSPGPRFERGMALLGRYTVLAEGARGSLCKQAIARFELAKGRQPPKFALGLKELWQVDADKHEPGAVFHSFGWPLDNSVGGGAFLYHLAGGRVAVGLVIHLNYKDPYLSPFEAMQQFKTHKAVRDVFAGATRIGYGARAIAVGGWQSVPKLAFAGGVLVGDAAGFVNVPRIKGSHNAMMSGMEAAGHLAAALKAGRGGDVLEAYEEAWRAGPIGKDLKRVRNVKPLLSRFGTLLGTGIGGTDMWLQTLTGWSPLGTLAHGGADHQTTKAAAGLVPATYREPDGVLTFDRLGSVALTNTGHRNDEPGHLVVGDDALQVRSEHGIYAGPSGRYCPAAVYEWIKGADGPQFVINAQNCIHCKTCDIKDPNQNINWTMPEGGGGPNYEAM